MPTVRVHVTNPEARLIEEGERIWIVAGDRPEDIVDRIRTGSFVTPEHLVADHSGESTVVRIDDDPSIRIRAHRGITSSFDWFYTRNGDTVVVGDHFREVLASVPVHRRTVPDRVVREHLLLGGPVGRSHVEAVGRLGHGETLVWNVDRADRPDVRVTERLRPRTHLSPSSARKRIDEYLRRTLSSDRFTDSTTMLSGGTDSTLMQSYLNAPTTVSAAYDSPEFAFEVENACRASDALGTTHELVRRDESDILADIETATDAAGVPLKHLQTPIIHRAATETTFTTYVNGEKAGGLFGYRTDVGHRLAGWTSPVIDAVPTVDWRVDWLKRSARGLQTSVFDPNGVAMGFDIFADERRVAELFGPDGVRDIKRARRRYVTERMTIDDETGFGPHVHLGHSFDFFEDSTVPIERRAIHADGKALVNPYLGKELVETVLSVPPERRYVRRLTSKYLLEDLLDRRVPTHEPHEEPGNTALPMERYQRTGPLSDAFERYAVPEIVPADRRAWIENATGHLSWYALSYAIWRDRVLRDDSFEGYESTRTLVR